MTSVLQHVQKQSVRKVPDIRVGQTVRVHQKIKEGNKERIQIFEGLVLKLNSGYGADKTFTVRKLVSGIGVEKIFPLFSPAIEKIEIKKKSKVRRAKLYYMRDRSGKSARLKASFVSEKELESSINKLAAEKAVEDDKQAAEDAKVQAAEEAKAAAEQAEAEANAPAPADTAAESEGVQNTSEESVPEGQTEPSSEDSTSEETAEPAPTEEAPAEEAEEAEPEAEAEKSE
jgi:large subunit ribosomal protein L19